MLLGGLMSPREVLVSPVCQSSSSPSRQQSAARCGPGETLRLACPPFAACSGRMITALCKNYLIPRAGAKHQPWHGSRADQGSPVLPPSSAPRTGARTHGSVLPRHPPGAGSAWGGRRCPKEPLPRTSPTGRVVPL